jgi:preprotein translocase subunit SecD
VIGWREAGAPDAGKTGQEVAILLDGCVVMAPIIQTEISGGVALIQGGFTKDKAREIARGIQASPR